LYTNKSQLKHLGRFNRFKTKAKKKGSHYLECERFNT